MKPQGIEIPLRKLHKPQKITLQIATAIILLITIIPLFLKTYSSSPSSSTSSSSSSNVSKDGEINGIVAASSTTEGNGSGEGGLSCDIFAGEWVPNPEAPYYTNRSCWAIHDQQNCMKYGRPDAEFMKWRWKPNCYDLPIFNPSQFLEIVRGKSMAFVGDSVGRNQMQSLICLLSRVEYPIDVSDTGDDRFKRLQYKIHNFTLASFWTPFLVKAKEHDPDETIGAGLFSLYLDELDESWSTKIDEFDYLIVSDGHWFFRPLIYRHNGRLIGCHSCMVRNLTDYPAPYGYRLAFRTAFRAIINRENFKGITYLRTFSPAHFDGGAWDGGGNCMRKRPFESNEAILEGVYLDMYNAQIEEFRVSEKEGRERGLKFRVIDVTHAMLLRPDGHPSGYGHWKNDSKPNDCVHWCMPGPIDTWNDFLLDMMKME